MTEGEIEIRNKILKSNNIVYDELESGIFAFWLTTDGEKCCILTLENYKSFLSMLNIAISNLNDNRNLEFINYKPKKEGPILKDILAFTEGLEIIYRKEEELTDVQKRVLEQTGKKYIKK